MLKDARWRPCQALGIRSIPILLRDLPVPLRIEIHQHPHDPCLLCDQSHTIPEQHALFHNGNRPVNAHLCACKACNILECPEILIYNARSHIVTGGVADERGGVRDLAGVRVHVRDIFD